MLNELRIAIDGGASTGKSTISNMLADRLNLYMINTGATYRLAALIAVEKDLIGKWEELVNELKLANIRFDKDVLMSNYQDIHDRIHSPEAAAVVSEVASSPCVREFLSNLQKEIGKTKGIILEGRDIGTVVMTDADYKFFLTVSDEEAAKRRHNEYISKGKDVSFEEVLKNVRERNEIDSNRAVAPLKKAEDAILVDTTGKTPDEIIEEMISHIK